MHNLHFLFEYPWLLLLLIPAIGLSLLPYFLSNKRYRRNRNRIVSLVAHTLTLVLSVFLLSGMTVHYEIPNDKNEIILLVDVSDSNEQSMEDKNDFVHSVLNVVPEGFKAGVVKFGYDQVYASKLNADVNSVYEQYVTSQNPDVTATNISSALEYTATLFTNPKSAKIVLLSDGVETDGKARSVIKSIAAQGIRIDTVCFPNKSQPEAQILSVKTPSDNIVPDEHFNLAVTLQTNEIMQVVDLTVYDNGVEISRKERVLLMAEEQVVEIDCLIEKNGMHELRVELAISEQTDTIKQNNKYISYINIESYENILVVERNEGESAELVDILGATYTITSLSVEEDVDLLPKTIDEFCEYEQVVLVNIAYSDMPAGFEELLNEYVYNLGGGLFTVGGENETVDGKLVPHAYNRDDMNQSTYYKQMLPVIAEDYTPPIAVMIVVDTSGSMGSGKLPAALKGAEACLDLLSDRDYCGVVSFSSISKQEVEVLPVAKRMEVLQSIRAINSETSDAGQGGTIFSSAISRAGTALNQVDVERKHIVLITDGQPGDTLAQYGPFIDMNVESGITMSIMGIKTESSDATTMTEVALRAGGKFYQIDNYDNIPAIMTEDLRMEAIPTIAYGEEFNLTIKDNTHITTDIKQEDIPVLSGYYGTTAKNGVEIALMGKYVPMYAEWNYGKGRVGSFMSDLNGTWSEKFIYDGVGVAIINNIVKGLFPATAPSPQKIEYVFTSENYFNQLSVYNIGEEEKVTVEIIPYNTTDDSYIDDVTVQSFESGRRHTFDIKQAGIYEILITKTDLQGNYLYSTSVFKAFSYSQEYNAFPQTQFTGDEHMQLIATDGKGAVLEDPIQAYDGFLKMLDIVWDPRIFFLIVAILAVLVDVAVRKFKFKWPHEIVRERKQKNEEQKLK